MAIFGGIGIAGAFAVAKSFVSANKYIIMAAVLVAGAGYTYYKVDKYLDDRDERNQQIGYDKAEGEFQEAVRLANAEVEEKNTQLAAMNISFDKLAEQRTAEVEVKFEPIIRSITNEVTQDPVYRTCVVSDSVRNNINSGRSTVNEAIDSSTPSKPRPRPTEAPEDTNGGIGGVSSFNSDERREIRNISGEVQYVTPIIQLFN